jgi:hypothetical protein
MNLKQEYASTNSGEMFSTWIGGATGRGCDRLVIDDPHSAVQALSPVELQNTVEYVRTALFTRLDQPAKGSIVVVMQRLHENDLVGELLQPGRDASTERLDLSGEKVSSPGVDYSMFTNSLRVY